MHWQPQGVSPDVARMAWPDTAGQGSVRYGRARSGAAGLLLMISALRASALSAGFLGTQMWCAWAWMGKLWRALVRSELVRQGEDCKRQYGGLRPSLLFFREQMWHGLAGHSEVRPG